MLRPFILIFFILLPGLFTMRLQAQPIHELQPASLTNVATGTTTRVSVASDGTQANGSSDAPAISADGRYVAFAPLHPI